MSKKKKKKKKPQEKPQVKTFRAAPEDERAEYINVSYKILPPSDKFTTDIILVLYGGRKDLDRCIVSIKKHCSNYKLHVIDNNLINRGFTKAVNSGILSGEAPYVWLLNQDAVVLAGAQEALIERFDYGPKVGIAGSMQIDYNDRDVIRHGGTFQAFPFGIHKGGRISMGHCRLPEKSTWINFASVMFRREMIRHIGLLDENMFLLFSDSDYCYWARYRGWEVWYEPRSQVLHRLGEASKSVSEWHQKDKRAFMSKWSILSNGGQSDLFRKLDTYP
jgi:hypothetical protein